MATRGTIDGRWLMGFMLTQSATLPVKLGTEWGPFSDVRLFGYPLAILTVSWYACITACCVAASQRVDRKFNDRRAELAGVLLLLAEACFAAIYTIFLVRDVRHGHHVGTIFDLLMLFSLTALFWSGWWRRGKRVKKEIGAKARAAQDKLVESMPEPRANPHTV